MLSRLVATIAAREFDFRRTRRAARPLRGQTGDDISENIAADAMAAYFAVMLPR